MPDKPNCSCDHPGIDGCEEGGCEPIKLMWAQDGDVFLSADQIMWLIEGLIAVEKLKEKPSEEVLGVLSGMMLTIDEAISSTINAMVFNAQAPEEAAEDPETDTSVN